MRFYRRVDGTVLTRDCTDLPGAERSWSWRRPLSLLRSGVAAASLFAAGCNIGATQGRICPVVDQSEVTHLSRVRALAVEYQNVNGTAPTKLDQLERWAVGRGKASKEDFISTRDGKSYLLGPGPVVAESEGRGDRYFAGPQGTGPRSDEEIDKLLAPGLARAARSGGEDSVRELSDAQIKRLLAERARQSPPSK